jgi:hypothetical protein
LILILSVLLLSVTAADTAAAPAAAKSASTGDKKDAKKDGEKKDDKKMKIEGGLYTTDKVANVKSNKGNRPTMKLVSPMQRSSISKKYDDDDEGKY